MSIEAKLDALVTVIERLALAIESKGVAQPVTKQEPVVEPVVPVQAPQVAPTEEPVIKITGYTVVGTSSMPPVPTFPTIAPAPVLPAAPFSDAKGMLEYVTTAFRALGPSGAKIQGVITDMGHHNINEITPAEYAELYSRVEALKNGA